MKVLNISQDDWANFAYDNSMALRSVGVEADSVKRNPHVWGYDKESVVQDINQTRESIRQYDVIQFFHDSLDLFNEIKDVCADKRLVVYHTSSYYRKNYASIDHIMNIYADKVVCAMPEFMGLCNNRNVIYMVGAVDTDRLSPSSRTFQHTKFAHYPSNPEVKGTSQINQMMLEMGLMQRFKSSLKAVQYKRHLRRFNDSCNVYIELFSMRDSNGSPYGNFGISALEAASMGKIVVTNCLGIEVYEKHYGSIKLLIANDKEKFINTIQYLNGLSINEIEGLQKESREWIVKTHGYKASGEYMLKHIL